MYSQNNEEFFILEYFKNKNNGRFIDIGAFHPRLLSNTRALYEAGWGGVFVEPNPEQMSLFKTEYENDSKISLCCDAIHTSSGVFDFYISRGDALSTISEQHLKKWNKVKFEQGTVSTITPDMLFEKYGSDFDFLNLDVEGNNWDILRCIPFNTLNNLKLICVEYDGFYNEMCNFLNGLGFVEIHKNGENIILARK